VTRRANSVVPIDPPQDPQQLAVAVDRVESLCRAGGLPLRFRLMPENGHAGIDTQLAERGYELEAPCDLLELPLTVSQPGPDPRSVITTGQPTDDWCEAAWRLAPRSGDGARETMRAIMSGTPAVYAAIGGTADGESTTSSAAISPDGARVVDAIAVGRGALVNQGRNRSVVLDQIAVDEAHRRQGLGSAVLRTLLAAGQVQGADRALLEVECDNTAAISLYRSLGFTRISGYHYRALD
jgi:ribosomal protein S18 acetylase RimI-like enzyme